MISKVYLRRLGKICILFSAFFAISSSVSSSVSAERAFPQEAQEIVARAESLSGWSKQEVLDRLVFLSSRFYLGGLVTPQTYVGVCLVELPEQDEPPGLFNALSSVAEKYAHLAVLSSYVLENDPAMERIELPLKDEMLGFLLTRAYTVLFRAEQKVEQLSSLRWNAIIVTVEKSKTEVKFNGYPDLQDFGRFVLDAAQWDYARGQYEQVCQNLQALSVAMVPSDLSRTKDLLLGQALAKLGLVVKARDLVEPMAEQIIQELTFSTWDFDELYLLCQVLADSGSEKALVLTSYTWAFYPGDQRLTELLEQLEQRSLSQ